MRIAIFLIPPFLVQGEIYKNLFELAQVGFKDFAEKKSNALNFSFTGINFFAII